MGSGGQRPLGRADRPSTKPLFVVAGLLMSAAMGAAVTTRSVPAPVRHNRPVHPIVVVRVERPGASGRVRAFPGPGWY